MNQLFTKKDPRRRWNGYWIHFYPNEHIPPDNKPLNWLHLHFRGQKGEIELYLKEKDYRTVHQWGKIVKEEITEIKKFVRENYQDIIEIVKKQLKEIGINWDGKF